MKDAYQEEQLITLAQKLYGFIEQQDQNKIPLDLSYTISEQLMISVLEKCSITSDKTDSTLRQLIEKNLLKVTKVKASGEEEPAYKLTEKGLKMYQEQQKPQTQTNGT